MKEMYLKVSECSMNNILCVLWGGVERISVLNWIGVCGGQLKYLFRFCTFLEVNKIEKCMNNGK